MLHRLQEAKPSYNAVEWENQRRVNVRLIEDHKTVRRFPFVIKADTVLKKHRNQKNTLLFDIESN